jgi:hypothetical protein
MEIALRTLTLDEGNPPYPRDPGEERHEGFEDALLNNSARRLIHPSPCVHKETGFEFSPEILVNNPMDNNGNSCMLAGSVLGLIPGGGGNACAPEPDNGIYPWYNLLGNEGCQKNQTCSSVVDGNVTYEPDMLGGPACMLKMKPNLTLEQVSQFDMALMSNVSELSSSSNVYYLREETIKLDKETDRLRQLSAALRTSIADLKVEINDYTIKIHVLDQKYNQLTPDLIALEKSVQWYERDNGTCRENSSKLDRNINSVTSERDSAAATLRSI